MCAPPAKVREELEFWNFGFFGEGQKIQTFFARGALIFNIHISDLRRMQGFK